MTSTTAPPVPVRAARPEEGGAVAALLRDTYTTFADELPPELLRAWLDDVVDPGGATTLVALVDGTPAGTARLHPVGTYPVALPAGSAGVRAVAVAPAFRRRGVARALMAVCAERARAAGATALHLHTAPFMTAATGLYASLGYRRDPAVDLDVGVRFGSAPPGAAVVAAYRLELAPAVRVVRGDPNEQESVVPMPELDGVPDRRTS
jgi:GNAT superfamily N-acetyltransferase